MRQILTQRTFFMLVVCVLLLATAGMASDGATGTWKCVAKGLPDGDVEFTLELNQSGDSLTGTISSESGSVEISDAKIHGDNFEFTVVAPDAHYKVTGSVSGNAIKGEWKDDREHSGTWDGQKQG